MYYTGIECLSKAWTTLNFAIPSTQATLWGKRVRNEFGQFAKIWGSRATYVFWLFCQFIFGKCRIREVLKRMLFLFQNGWFLFKTRCCRCLEDQWTSDMEWVNPSRPNLGRREKLSFYFDTSLWCFERFYEEVWK